MTKFETMRTIFELYGYTCEINDTKVGEGRVVFASFYKSYNEYKWCYLKATYLNGDIETDLVANGGAIPTSDSTLLNEAFAEMNECQHIIKLLEKWL